MIKKIGLPLIALTAVLAFATPKQADARVRFGVGVGIGGPAYVAPYPSYASPYCGPYAPCYGPYPGYAAPGPVYVAPSVGVGLGFGYGGGYGYGYRAPVVVNRGYVGGGFHGRAGFRGRR
jgi:hypothetical protein